MPMILRGLTGQRLFLVSKLHYQCLTAVAKVLRTTRRSTKMLTAERTVFSWCQKMSRQMILKQHCQAAHSTSQRTAATVKARLPIVDSYGATKRLVQCVVGWLCRQQTIKNDNKYFVILLKLKRKKIDSKYNNHSNLLCRCFSRGKSQMIPLVELSCHFCVQPMFSEVSCHMCSVLILVFRCQCWWI